MYNHIIFMGCEFLSPLSKIQQKVGESKYVICRTETEEKEKRYNKKGYHFFVGKINFTRKFS